MNSSLEKHATSNQQRAVVGPGLRVPSSGDKWGLQNTLHCDLGGNFWNRFDL